MNARKYYVDIDCACYPSEGVTIDFALNDYVDQYRDLKLVYKEYVGVELLNPFIIYTDMKTKNPIQVIDLKFQVDRKNSEKDQVFEECRGATNIARLFIILIRHRANKMISDQSKISENNII